MNVLSLCSGVGAIDLGLRVATRGRARTVGYVEREAFSASVIVARIQAQALDPAPIWDDLATFDGTRYRGKVDLLVAGLPCQPFSLAGLRKGHADERSLWPEFVRIADEVQPGLVFFENVPPLPQALRTSIRPTTRNGFRVRSASASLRKRVRRAAYPPTSLYPCCPPRALRPAGRIAVGARAEWGM